MALVNVDEVFRSTRIQMSFMNEVVGRFAVIFITQPQIVVNVEFMYQLNFFKSMSEIMELRTYEH